MKSIFVCLTMTNGIGECNMKSKRKNKGFTLVELIVVIVILSILVGVTLGGIYTYVNKAKLNTDINNANNIYSAMQVLLADDQLTKLALTDAKKGHGYQQFLEHKNNNDGSYVGGYMLVFKNNIPSVEQKYFWFENTDTFIDRCWVQGSADLGAWVVTIINIVLLWIKYQNYFLLVLRV